MFIELHPKNPNARDLKIIVQALENGKIVILPTDTLYTMCCSIKHFSAIEKLAKIQGRKTNRASFSLLCKDLSNLSEYGLPLNNAVFKLMKQVLPGPFTFIIRANKIVEKIFKENKKTIGIRVPDNQIVQDIIALLGHPLVCASIHSMDDNTEYMSSPDEINELFQSKVDIIIDGGTGGIEASTIIDCTLDIPEIIREGKGIELILR